VKIPRILLIGALLWVATTGVARASGEAVPDAGADAGQPQRTFVCPDLASTDLFRSKGLQYVHTLAFAEAVAAVAGGTSPFAPQPVPKEWSSVAAQWYLHLVAHDAETPGAQMPPLRWEGFSADDAPCDPVLLHKASLEYRSIPGNGKAGVLFPYYVPIAAHELEEKILALARRGERIAAKIALAERMGAAQCSPGTVAKAKAGLEGANRIAANDHYSPEFSDPTYGAAERLADELTEGRRIAAALGITCYTGN